MQTAKLPSPCWKIAGSTTVPSSAVRRRACRTPTKSHHSASEPLSSIPVVVHVARRPLEAEYW